jgi:hypothetical protein
MYVCVYACMYMCVCIKIQIMTKQVAFEMSRLYYVKLNDSSFLLYFYDALQHYIQYTLYC